MFNHKEVQKELLKAPGTVTLGYGIGTEWKQDSQWRLVGVYHLTGPENVGKHNVYIEALTKEGVRARVWVGWTWEGRRPNERADPFFLDKPDNEPAGNLGIWWGQKIKLWIKGESATSEDLSDAAFNLHTDHPDEDGWNTKGHHSFYVLFQEAGAMPPLPEPEPSDAHQTLVEIKKLLDGYFDGD